jgi:ribosomal protein L16 Arg81 hydroxylase
LLTAYLNDQEKTMGADHPGSHVQAPAGAAGRRGLLNESAIKTLVNGRAVTRLRLDHQTGSAQQAAADSSPTSSPAEGLSALGRIVSPLSPDDFLRSYWEQQPLVQRRSDRPSWFHDLMTLIKFDRLVACGNLNHPCVRLFRQSAMIPPEQFRRSRQTGSSIERDMADLNPIYDAYLNGDAILLQSVDTVLPPLGLFCRELERTLNSALQADVALSPPNSRGPLTQFETCSLFVLQVEGTSHWEIHPPPPSQESLTAGQAPDNVTLQAGDSFYLPRGSLYRESASESYTLHISIKASVNRWMDLFTQLCETSLSRSESEIKYRCALPVGRPPGAALQPPWTDYFNELVDELLAGWDLESGYRLVGERLAARQSTRPVGAPDRFEEIDRRES